MLGLRIGATGFMDAANWVQNRLRAFEVRLPAGNRLLKASDIIREVNEGARRLSAEDESLLYLVSEAQWTIIEQYIIARSLGRPIYRLDPKRIAMLETMLSGAATENADANPTARNTQFELYAAATLVMGDVPSHFDEPDFRVDYLGTEIGVAAKRVRSVKQLGKRTKEAVDQIRRSGIPGIVALNVDVLMKAVGPDVTNDIPLNERLTALDEVDATLGQYEEVVGALVFARDTVWDFRGERPSVGIASTHRFTTYPRTPEQRYQGEEFWQRARAKIDERFQKM